jgi:hypothetical protein
MRERLQLYPGEALKKRIELLCPRGGSMAHTAEICLTAAFNLADGVMTLDEFIAVIKYGTTEKRAKKIKPAPKHPKGRPERTPKEQSPW